MDSFFSLFDPSDGEPKQGTSKRKKNTQPDDNVKKKDAPKGRRRGRKSSDKKESLAEESSFLCEPEYHADVHDKEASYIDNYCTLGTEFDDTKDADKKPKRRNSGRKNRRKKSKISPAKESFLMAWESELDPKEGLNNINSVKKNNLGEVGKGVNNLKTELEDSFDYVKSSKRKDNFDKNFYEKQVNNVIDKLSDVSLLSGEEWQSKWCSSDDSDQASISDSESDISCGEYGPRLPPEPRFGNVEYKLHLVAPSEKRFQHLVTQLKWRLASGGGQAVYLVGVRDSGQLVGLRARALRASLRTLAHMAHCLRAALEHAHVRRVAPHRASAEVYVRKLPDTQQSVELRVAVMGANEAGKSTLIGVLTQGELDNGRGSARLNMFRHVHEVRSGNTSSLSHEILGFDAKGNVVNYGCSELMTAERIGERSAKLVSFLDLAGHSKYQRTTVHGLTGYSPHYAMLVVSATAGVTPITEQHMNLLLALELPFFTVISKCELQPNSVADIVRTLEVLLGPAKKKPLLITDEDAARNCVGPKRHILDSIDNDTDFNFDKQEDDNIEPECVPVFPVSSVRGLGLNSLHAYLLALHPPTRHKQTDHAQEPCEFQIDEIFHVGESTGPVVGGLLARGTLCEGDELLIGPLETGEFTPVTISSIYRNRAPALAALAGQSGSVALRGNVPPLRQGLVLLQPTKPCMKCQRRRKLLENSKLKQDANVNIYKPNEEVSKLKKTDSDENVYKLNQDVSKINEDHPKLNQDVSEINEDHPKLNQDVSKINEDHPKLNQDVSEINEDHPKLNQDDSKINEDHPKLNQDDSKINEDHPKLNQDVSKINEDHPKLNQDVSEINEDVSSPNLKKTASEDVNRNNSDDTKTVIEEKIEGNIEGKIDCDCEKNGEVDDPRGCLYFQATIHLLRHSAEFINPGFQCTVHVGNVRQTAIVEGILSTGGRLRVGCSAACVLRFVRVPEYLRVARRLLLRAGPGTTAVGTVTQLFPLQT